jgi:hypothetical protein
MFSTNVPLPHEPDLLMAEARPMRASAFQEVGCVDLTRSARNSCSAALSVSARAAW